VRVVDRCNKVSGWRVTAYFIISWGRVGLVLINLIVVPGGTTKRTLRNQCISPWFSQSTKGTMLLDPTQQSTLIWGWVPGCRMVRSAVSVIAVRVIEPSAPFLP
jgi:hypothetical protein